MKHHLQKSYVTKKLLIETYYYIVAGSTVDFLATQF